MRRIITMRYNEKMHPLLGNAADIIEKNYDYGWKVKDVLKVLRSL